MAVSRLAISIMTAPSASSSPDLRANQLGSRPDVPECTQSPAITRENNPREAGREGVGDALVSPAVISQCGKWLQSGPQCLFDVAHQIAVIG